MKIQSKNCVYVFFYTLKAIIPGITDAITGKPEDTDSLVITTMNLLLHFVQHSYISSATTAGNIVPDRLNSNQTAWR